MTKIGYGEFDGCESLQSINIPDSVTTIKEGAFDYCLNLKSITVGANNPNYVSIDTVLFTKDMKKIICYAPHTGRDKAIVDQIL